MQTLAVELADRRIMEHDVWNKIGNGDDVFAPAPGMGILAGGGDAPLPERLPHAVLRQQPQRGRDG